MGKSCFETIRLKCFFYKSYASTQTMLFINKRPQGTSIASEGSFKQQPEGLTWNRPRKRTGTK